MSKLVNLQLLEAKNVICVWREDDGFREAEKELNNEYGKVGFAYCLESINAEANYMIPRYIAVGTFMDGEAKVAGISDLNSINNKNGNSDIFLYDDFLHKIDHHTAKAFVRFLVADGDYDTETDAKKAVLLDMREAGVEITEDAMLYLLS